MSRWIPAMLLAGLSAAAIPLFAQDPTHMPPPPPPTPATTNQDPTHMAPPPPPVPETTTAPSTSTAPSKTLEARPEPKTTGKQIVPPEEDKSFLSDEHSFNPLQSQKSVEVGDHYFHNGKMQGAIYRYQDATLWNDGNAEAWRKLGQAEEKINDRKAAIDAYNKYLDLSPKAKDAASIRKKVEELKTKL